jgi:hypothetical protein
LQAVQATIKPTVSELAGASTHEKSPKRLSWARGRGEDFSGTTLAREQNVREAKKAARPGFVDPAAPLSSPQ